MNESDIKEFIKNSLNEILIEKKETLKQFINEILLEREMMKKLNLKSGNEDIRKLGIYDLGGQFDNLNIRDYAHD
jgi:phosphatidate phosphatase PAH1